MLFIPTVINHPSYIPLAYPILITPKPGAFITTVQKNYHTKFPYQASTKTPSGTKQNSYLPSIIHSKLLLSTILQRSKKLTKNTSLSQAKNPKPFHESASTPSAAPALPITIPWSRDPSVHTAEWEEKGRIEEEGGGWLACQEDATVRVAWQRDSRWTHKR